jgi:hypothetical protein
MKSLCYPSLSKCRYCYVAQLSRHYHLALVRFFGGDDRRRRERTGSEVDVQFQCEGVKS